ncbi:MAG: zf-HC2 domain-containing protein [Candidatus Acidiferrales bacterium]
MKCEDVSNELMAFIDGRVKSGERRGIEDHLAGCRTCRTRAEEFRKVWTVLEEVPAIEPSFGFDARLRQRIGAEPRPAGFFSIFARPRLALSMALLAALLVVVVKLPLGNPAVQPVSATVQQEDFNAIKNLGVLENYDVVTKLGALSDLAPTADDAQPQGQLAGSDGGGA